ncbi:hypothetical protein A2Z33_06755 [Candidatus Gottesmanbacteria bacterium RBG_16_52_11]|mgnify:CR=1 FL=1|uniref:DUF1648 domain-containing protein n=1 Tax=Candidatus Gottesmanbacteria bacterium RBG_16_52_11 TaxID=1798374 RepID=A0A1F5YXZ1_9BACT|nr:MAG: hypothetical protein A2Z33_06755 [Candidatus Gottesmanbacteria bacterium RBG_16_52_11]
MLRILPEFPSAIRHKFRVLKKNWMFSAASSFALVSALISPAAIIITWKNLPPVVPLWFSRPWGADRLAFPAFLFLLPLSAIVIYVTNSFISLFYLLEYRIFVQLMLLISIIVSSLALLVTVQILLLVL